VRRVRALIAATVVTVPFLTVLAAAGAAAACQVRANLPGRIGIDRDTVVVPVSLAGCEGVLSEADAAVYGPPGVTDYLSWQASRTAYLRLDTFQVTPGSYRTIEGNGYTQSFDPVDWQYTSTTVKFSTRTGVSLVRRGSTVDIAVATYRFAAYSGFVGYGSHVVGVQHSLSPDGPWTTISYARVGPAGRVTIRKTAPGVRYYRAYFGDSGSFFGSYSGAVRG
jgi:hypothetical protein